MEILIVKWYDIYYIYQGKLISLYYLIISSKQQQQQNKDNRSSV